MSNAINKAVQRVAKDAMLQKIDSIAITYQTKDGQVYSFSLLEEGAGRFALIGMIEDLKREAFKHHIDEPDDED